MTLRFALSTRPGTHQAPWGQALAEGLRRHGLIQVPVEARPDFIACWGWRAGRRLQRLGHQVLVLERGYLGDRFAWTSLGWNGLNGRALFPDSGGPERLAEQHPGILLPWRAGGDVALILGQVGHDAALAEVNIAAWYVHIASRLALIGWRVAFRQHPVEVERGYPAPAFSGAITRRRGATLAEDLDGVGLAVAWNSNGLTDCACLGVPVLAADRGAMAWPVASHRFEEEPVRPDRQAWAEHLAWCQWSAEEIASGVAWDHVRAANPNLPERRAS